jgi:hypothetical protein
MGVNFGARIAEITDGTSSTMVLGEYLRSRGGTNDQRGLLWGDQPGYGHIYTQLSPNSGSPDLPPTRSGQNGMARLRRGRHPRFLLLRAGAGGTFAVMSELTESSPQSNRAIRTPPSNCCRWSTMSCANWRRSGWRRRSPARRSAPPRRR